MEHEYEKFVDSMLLPTARSLEYLVLGLCSEAGEVASKLKKIIRDTWILSVGREYKRSILMELGNVLFYTTAIANYHGFTLQKVIAANKEKLTARKEKGTISGEGDSR